MMRPRQVSGAADRGRGKARRRMKAQRPDELKRAMAACRRVWAGIGAFSAFLNLLMLSVPIYMMQLYDRVLSTRNVDTLLALTVMVIVALLVLGLLDALRGRVLARVGGWLDQELGGLVLSGAVADALRAGGGVSAQGLRDLAKIRGYLGGPGVTPLFDAPWAPVFLAIIYFIHPVLGLIGIGGAVVLLVCAVLNDLTTRRKLTEANNASTTRLQHRGRRGSQRRRHRRDGHAAQTWCSGGSRWVRRARARWPPPWTLQAASRRPRRPCGSVSRWRCSGWARTSSSSTN